MHSAAAAPLPKHDGICTVLRSAWGCDSCDSSTAGNGCCIDSPQHHPYVLTRCDLFTMHTTSERPFYRISTAIAE